MNYHHALRLDETTVVSFYPNHPKGSLLAAPVLDKTTTLPLPEWLEGFPMVGYRDGGVDINDVLVLVLHLVFDKDGDVVQLCPTLVRYLCMMYMVAHDIPRDSLSNYIPYTLYCRQLEVRTHVPVNDKIAGVLCNTTNTCKSIFHKGDDKPEHPYAKLMFMQNVCVECYEKAFVDEGLSVEEVRTAMNPCVFDLMIAPLLQSKMRQFLVGLVLRQFMGAFGIEGESVTTLGEIYLKNPDGFMGMYFKNTNAFRVLMQLTDAYHWVLYVTACKFRYRPEYKFRQTFVYFGWMSTTAKLSENIYGDGKYTRAFEDAPRPTIYQSVYIHRKKKIRIVMETNCYLAWQKISKLKENHVCIYPTTPSFIPAIVTLDAADCTWPGAYTWPKEVHVINSELITWTQLIELLDSGKKIYLYGNLEKAYMGYGDIGGVFCVLVDTFRTSQPKSPVVVESDIVAGNVESAPCHDYIVSDQEWPLTKSIAWRAQEVKWIDVYQYFGY